MTVARGLAVGALAIAVAVVLALLLLGSGDSHAYKMEFLNAGQLVKGDAVQVGGRPVGSVQSIDLTNDNHAMIAVKMNGAPAPLHEGTTAVVRATSLSGIANRYISVTPGPNSNPKIPDNSVLGTDKTTSIVDLDQLFNTLDRPTVESLQQIVRGSAEQYKGVTKSANEAAKYFNPTLSTTARLVNEVNRDTGTFTDFLVQSSKVVTALSQRSATLTNLVTNTNQTAGAIAAQRESLNEDLIKLPPFMRRANTTFVNLRAALDDLDRLVNASKPATKRLGPLLVALRPLVHRAVPTVADLRKTIRSPGANNDLTDLMRKLPKLGNQARVVFPRGVKTLQESQPVLDFVRPYVPEVVGWLRDFGEGAASYDGNGHYARIQPIFNAFSLTGNPLSPALSPTLASNRLQGIDANNLKRCPGTATQIRPDHSNDWRDTSGTLDCDPSQVLPGEFNNP
jgi:phospholipid/cholesterol/gamma-HCH transport system substrate-binding protein